MVKILFFTLQGNASVNWAALGQPPLQASTGEEAAALMCEDPRIAVVVVEAGLAEEEFRRFSEGLYARAMPFELVCLTEEMATHEALVPVMQHYEMVPWVMREGENLGELLQKAVQKARAARHLYEVRMGMLTCQGFVGSSSLARELRERLARAALNDHPVLIAGPDGCGKERLARLIHSMSPRRCNGPFRQVSAAVMASADASLRLFGGRSRKQNAEQTKGLIDESPGGTLSLLGIHRASQNLHLRLTELVTTRNFCRVGSSHPEAADVRLVLTTRSADAIDDAHHLFGPDLMQRLLSNMIEVPPLSQRKEDVPAFAEHLSRMIWEKYRPDSLFPGFHSDALEMLAGVLWPLDRMGLELFLERYFLLVGLDAKKAIGARELELELTPWLETAKKQPPHTGDMHSLRFAREMNLDYPRMENETLYAFLAIQKRRHGKRELAELFNKSSRWLEITLNNLAEYFLSCGLRTRDELRRDQIWNRKYENQHKSPEEVNKA